MANTKKVGDSLKRARKTRAYRPTKKYTKNKVYSDSNYNNTLIDIRNIYPSEETVYYLQVRDPDQRNRNFSYKVTLIYLKFNNYYQDSEFHFKILNSKLEKTRILSANRYDRIWWLYAFR